MKLRFLLMFVLMASVVSACGIKFTVDQPDGWWLADSHESHGVKYIALSKMGQHTVGVLCECRPAGEFPPSDLAEMTKRIRQQRHIRSKHLRALGIFEDFRYETVIGWHVSDGQGGSRVEKIPTIIRMTAKRAAEEGSRIIVVSGSWPKSMNAEMTKDFETILHSARCQ